MKKIGRPFLYKEPRRNITVAVTEQIYSYVINQGTTVTALIRFLLEKEMNKNISDHKKRLLVDVSNLQLALKEFGYELELKGKNINQNVIKEFEENKLKENETNETKQTV